MNELLSKNQLKELELIMKLNYVYPKLISQDDLANELFVSVHSIKHLIFSISERNFDFEINYKKVSGYSLNQPITKSIDKIRLIYLKDSIMFKLCISSFSKEYETSHSFATQNYISLATLYNRITDLNELLEKYSLKFDAKDGSISGKTSDYRYFFYNLFWLSYRMQPCEQLKIFIDEIDTIIKSLDIFPNLNSVQIRQLTFALFISFSQIVKKKYIDSEFPVLIIDSAHYELLKKVFTEKFYFIDFLLLKREVCFFYSFIVSLQLFTDSSTQLFRLFKKNDKKNTDYALNFVKSIQKNFKGIFTSKKHKTNFLSEILSINFCITNFPRESDLVNKFNLLQFYTDYKFFFKQFLCIFLDHEKKFSFSNNSATKHITRSYRFKSYLLYLSSFVNIAEFNQIFLIKTISDCSINQNLLEKLIFNEPQLSLFTLENESPITKKPDLILTNLDLGDLYSHIPVTTISIPPTKNDLSSIYTALDLK